MNVLFSATGGALGLFVFALASGILVSRAGNPYPTLIFTVHKLVAVGTIFLVLRTVYRLQEAASVRSSLGASGLLLVGLLFTFVFISGAVLSVHDGAVVNVQQPLLALAHQLHRVAPVLALLAAVLVLRLLTLARAG